MATGVIQE